jgi:hypothetical protein
MSIMCEEKQCSEMLRIGGCFWEAGLDAVEKGVERISREEEEAEEDEWEKEVVEALDSLKNVKVDDGYVYLPLLMLREILMRSLQPPCGSPIPRLSIAYHPRQDKSAA